MRTFSIIFALVLMLLGLAGCEKKRYPENIADNQAVFYFDAVVDGTYKKIMAGEDNYYMFASYHNNGNLLHFSADLRRTDCGNCEGIEFILTDNHLSPPGAGLSDSSLRSEPYIFARENAKEYEVKFTSGYNRGAKNYLWSFGDGVVSTEANPIHKFKGPGKYRVCLTIESTAGCFSQVCNVIDLSEDPFRTQVTTQQMSGNTILFTQHTVGKAPFKFYWSFGDGTVSTMPSPTHTYSISGSYHVLLTVSDALGNTITYQYNAVTGNDESSCAANMNLATVTSALSSQLQAASIKWVDDQGREYFSVKTDQPEESYFRVVKVEEFERNESSQPTKKLVINFSCSLTDGTKTIQIRDAAAAISVAYP